MTPPILEPKKRLLSIQGGGIRGIIPACHLVELERQTGKLTRAVFDYIGGTSTGALLVATIAAGVPATKSLDVYLGHGREIFSPTNSAARRLALLTKGRQFDSKVLYKIVSETLGVPASTWSVNESPIDILITASDQLGDALYFTKDKATNAAQFGKYSLLDAAVASACATTYHDPWRVNVQSNPFESRVYPSLGYCADGGCTGNADPVYELCVEAFSGNRCYGVIDPKDAQVVSLGTGYWTPEQIPNPPGSLIARVAWVTSALVGASKTISAQAVDRHWPGVLDVINSVLLYDIDEADVDQIGYLLHRGQADAARVDWKNLLGL